MTRNPLAQALIDHPKTAPEEFCHRCLVTPGRRFAERCSDDGCDCCEGCEKDCQGEVNEADGASGAVVPSKAVSCRVPPSASLTAATTSRRRDQWTACGHFTDVGGTS